MMKPICFSFALLYLLLGGQSPLPAQTTLVYPLEEDFEVEQGVFNPLFPIANPQGQTGTFQTTTLPANFCPESAEMQAYNFADNAGLIFDNNSGFLGCEYSIELLFKFDQLPSLFESPWVSLIRFQPGLDNGIFFEFNPLFGTFLEVWEGNTEWCSDFYAGFDVNDWQKLTVVRNCDGEVRFYFCGQLFSTCQDNNDLLLPGDIIIFFQDDPEVLSSEAQPGLVRNISLSNFAMTDLEVKNACDALCADLLGDCLVAINTEQLTCDPDAVGVDSLVLATPVCDSLFITTTILEPVDTTFLATITCDTAQVGTEIRIVPSYLGCDSVIVEMIDFAAAPEIQYFSTTCFPEEALVDTTQFACDSIVIRIVELIVIDTIYFPTLGISPGSTINVLGQTVDAPGLYCQSLTSVEGCDSTTCQQVDWLVATHSPESPAGMYVPNAFSPNGDGINDRFWIYSDHPAFEIVQLHIYDAHGRLLFIQRNQLPNDEAMGWDGRFLGQKMPSGVYMWTLEMRIDGQRKRTAGDLTLLQ
ncbi:MAG: gliding motility-associated C-terminal domain-containing protein [Bacteroidota bacterium]